MNWTDFVSENSQLWQLKQRVISVASLHYKNKNPKEAANIIYSAFTKEWHDMIEKFYPSYDEDGGDKAVKDFVKWIKEDRKG